MRYKKTTQKKPLHICDFPDCNEPGEYRAPKDRNLRDYYWFCLKHVTEYNKNWDFLKGLSPEEIEEHIQHDTIWQRPTWKLGHGGVKADPNVRDYFHVHAEMGMDGRYNPPPSAQPIEKKLKAALDFMELKMPVDPAIVKKQYKKLAKLYHPDTNKGDRDAEQRFKKLNDAYHYILERIKK